MHKLKIKELELSFPCLFNIGVYVFTYFGICSMNFFLDYNLRFYFKILIFNLTSKYSLTFCICEACKEKTSFDI
jgi:hypothetical protein